MKLFSYDKNGIAAIGICSGGEFYDLAILEPALAGTMSTFLENWTSHYSLALNAEKNLNSNEKRHQALLTDPSLLAPVPFPNSLRDGYAFRQHVAAARRNRRLDMIPAFDEFPIFYFGNHRSVFGPGDISCMPDHFEQLDFELEAAVVIGKKGRNIVAAEADSFIAGLMILNDLSARRLQMEEMTLSLGPAKGKDFATSTGPWLVTTDELAAFEVTPKAGHCGKAWNLSMTAAINNDEVSRGNLADMDWTFAELIERASYGVDLYPGDIIGSGTVGTGCLLELNGTARLSEPGHIDRWLMPGDRVTLKIDKLGALTNRLVPASDSHSLLSLKKRSGK